MRRHCAIKMFGTIRRQLFHKSFLNFAHLQLRRRKTTHCIDSWTVPIRSNGFAQIDTHFTTYIKPLDPLEYIENEQLQAHDHNDSNKNSARVSLNIALPDDSDVVIDDEFFDEFSKDIRYNPQVNIIKRRHHLVVRGRRQRKFSFPPEDITITIEVPLQFNLQINAADNADLHISNLEGGWIYDITTDKGNCSLSNLKGNDLHVKSSNGNIISKSLLLAEFGTLTVENTGMISVEKLQGRKFCLDSDSGSINTGPLYLQRGEVNSQTGSISLGDIHGDMEVKVDEGDISIGSVSGDLQATTNNGNVNLHLSQFKNVDLTTKQGDINLTAEKSTDPTTINVKAKEITFGSDVDVVVTSQDKGENFTILSATMNSTDNELENCTNNLKAEAKSGIVKVDCKDWFSSLNLTKQA